MLGLSIDAFEYLMPKHMWSVLPGGMPYLKLNLNIKS